MSKQNWPNIRSDSRNRFGGATQTDRTTVGATTQTNGPLGVQTDTTTGAATYYQRDPHGALISEITPAGEYYYAFDGQGSVIALIDTTGLQRAAYSYDPYGSHATATALNGALPANPWRYDSSYLDPSGLYHLAARYYDPTTGRFTQQDPAHSPSSGNMYAYCGGDPVNNSDPSGTDVQGTQQDPIPGQPIHDFQYTGLEPTSMLARPPSPHTVSSISSPKSSSNKSVGGSHSPDCVAVTVGAGIGGVVAGGLAGLAGGPFSEVTVPVGAGVVGLTAATAGFVGCEATNLLSRLGL